MISHYRLSRLMREQAFPVYRNDSITLTQTGIGKTAMAAGVAYTYAIFAGTKSRVWLNVGVAGHPQFTIGQALLAHKITDQDRDKSWYPPLITEPPCPTETLLTRSRPETGYGQETLYDMEGSGFYETASRFSSSELVQCFKIVSDNRSNPADSFGAEQVAALIAGRLDLIDILIAQMKALAVAPESQVIDFVDRFTRRWRFSHQQSLHLKSLLHRLVLLDPKKCPRPEQLAKLKNARAVLTYLEDIVVHLPIAFP